MRPFVSLCLTSLLLSSVYASIEDACKGVATARPNVGYDFCMSTLGADADPNSRSADPSGLAVVAARLSIAEATRMESRIRELMEAESDPSLGDCFNVCMEVYADAIDDLSDAIAHLGSRRYREAVTFLGAALDAPVNCEDAFGEMEEGPSPPPSPLAGEDGDYGRLAEIALTITASLG